MKKIVSLALVLALCLTFFPVMASAEEETANVWDGSVATEFAGGTGTAEDPYQIATGAQLAYLARMTNSGETSYEETYFILTSDINLNGEPWTQICNGDYDFYGNVDGKGHVISNVMLGTNETPVTGDIAGLFGATEGTIQNIFVDKISVNANVKHYVGGLIGYAIGPVKNCHVTNVSMNAKASAIGGLAGYGASENLIDGCSVSGEITAKSGCQSVGGFIGSIGRNAQVTYSSADVMVTAPKERETNVGGFIGRVNSYGELVIIKNSFATGNVTGGGYAGGFTGSMVKMNVQNCYATGNVTDAYAEMASFAGTNSASNSDNGIARNCYTTGSVVGTSVNTAAFLNETATARSEIANCYYLDANETVATDYEKATAKSLNQMKTKDFADALNNSDPANGWIYKAGQTPLCGAEPADYRAVDAALKEVPADLTSSYTDETVAALNTAKANVVRGKVIAKQSEVDAMANAITVAVKKLAYKPANYTAVDAAIAKVEELKKDDYKDFTAVEAAVNAVVRDKNITEQKDVDAMAKAINDAIAALEKKPSSSSSGSSRPRYDVTTPSKPENGSVTVDPERARSGSRVTVTVTPDSGYKLGELVVTDKDGKKLELTDKGNGQYTFTMPSGKVEVAAEFVKEVEVSPFADVATDAYYYDAVKWAVEKGVTNGVSETLFGPDQACTRAQIVTFLWRAAGSPEPKSGSSFADVAADAYYAKAVAWAVENGITKGTSETTFHPDETCTRAQGVTFLYRALGKLAAAQAGFTDVAADSYYADAVNWAAENGVTNGISETLFGPDGSCTRAQIVTFLYRAYQGK